MSFSKFSPAVQARLIKLGNVMATQPDLVIRPMHRHVYKVVGPILDALERKPEAGREPLSEGKQAQFGPLLDRLCRAIGPVEGRTWTISVQDSPELACALNLKKDGHSWRWTPAPKQPDLVIASAEVLKSILSGKVDTEWLGKEVKSSDMLGLMDVMVAIDAQALEQQP